MSDENVGGLVELLPCPFCGHDDSLYVMHIEGTILHPTYYVRCDYCGAQNGATDKGNHVEQWNTRALSAHGENTSVQTPMADSEMIERAAIAVFAADSGSVEAWPTATTREQDFFRRAALAALSAHGQPVVDGRYFADGPQGWFVTDNLELARALVSAYDKNDDWTVTDIGYVAGALG